MGDINSAIKHEATMTCRHREPQMRCLSTNPISKNLKPKTYFPLLSQSYLKSQLRQPSSI